MLTPKSYKDSVSKNEVTQQILGDVLLSYNKRAKNMRDQERKYRRYRYCDHNYVWQYEEKKQSYYSSKDKLLSLVEPIAIHEVERIRKGGTFTEYFLLYKIGDFTFHHPIDVNDLESYNLPIETLTDFETFGKDPTELLSVQFCDKVRDGLLNGSYSLVA